MFQEIMIGFQELAAVNHIAWADGPGWLIGYVVIVATAMSVASYYNSLPVSEVIPVKVKRRDK